MSRLTFVGDRVMYAKSMGPEPVQPPRGPLLIQSVVDHVYAALRERILSGELERGTRLRQASLADELGVSRTPLREALRRLASEGLVELSPNRGATVSMLDFGDMRHAWAARLALEPGAARLGAERRDGDAIARLRASVAAQRQAHRDGAESYAVNREFHLALVASSGNPHLMRFAEMLWVPRIGVPIYEMQADDPEQVLIWADEHERITDAVDAGDPGEADRLTREHIAAWPPVERP
jgi:DNA-binding GntR family transcriptional regulator